MPFTPNLVVGLVITLLGVVLTLERLALIDPGALLRYWPVALVLYGLSVVVQAFRPAGGEAAGPRPRPIISPGFVILMVIVWTLAWNGGPFRASRASTPDGVNLVGVMSQDTRVNEAAPFHGASMTSVMGGSRLDLRRALVAPGEEVVVDVFGLMGRVQIDVPREWVVDIQTTVMMGGVRDRGVDSRDWPGGRGRNFWTDPVPDEPPAPLPAAPATAGDTPAAPPRLVVRGFVMMGGLVIRS